MEAFSAMLEAARVDNDLPALAGAIFRHDEVLEFSVTGVKRWGSETPVQEDDLFHIGSNAKARSATLAALLVEEGRLHWRSTLKELLPNVPRHPGFEEVTLQHLLSHRAGVVPLTSTEEVEDLAHMHGTPTEQRAHLTAWALQCEPLHRPGTAVAYSNAGYAVAAAVLEQCVSCILTRTE